MQDCSTTEFNGKIITVQELTVKQVREIFERLKQDGQLFIDDLLDHQVPALIVTASTGISLEQLEDAKPSELDGLCKEVARVNPSLASMIQRRVEAADRLESVILSAKNLTGQSAQ